VSENIHRDRLDGLWWRVFLFLVEVVEFLWDFGQKKGGNFVWEAGGAMIHIFTVQSSLSSSREFASTSFRRTRMILPLFLVFACFVSFEPTRELQISTGAPWDLPQLHASARSDYARLVSGQRTLSVQACAF
jgi:hypothetical protein